MIPCRTARTIERDGRAWLCDDEAAMVAGWRKGHDMPDVPPAILPRLGVVAVIEGQDSAAGWLYMDNSVGVGFVEWLVTRPGLTLAESKGAIAAVLAALQGEARQNGYGLLLGHCIAPLARVAIRELGWQDMGSDARALAFPLV